MSFAQALFESLILQIAAIFGIFFVVAMILAKLEDWTEAKYLRTVGWKGILWTAWIGTPVHELSHAIFAKIFRHKIHKISLFSPDRNTGRLGHVDHSYNLNSLYQRIGNFFIGVAPTVMGGIILIALLYILVPNGKEIFSAIQNANFSLREMYDSTINILKLLFSVENLKLWKFWVFIYLSFCIATHISPSSADRKTMWRGFFWIILLLFVVNLLSLPLGKNLTPLIIKTSHYFSIVMAILAFTAIISAIHLVLINIFSFLVCRR